MNTQFDGSMGPLMGNVGMVPGGLEPNQFVSNMNVPTTSNGVASNMPPPIPPRPDLGLGMSQGMNPSYGMGSYGGMGTYGGMGGYGGMGMGSYGMGGGYGGFGGYGGGYGMGGMGGMYGGYNRFGMAPGYGDIESRFIQMAEEGSRPAFDSIQSLVNAVGSVAMMLENTFFALTSSFRAILGVAENFGRLRSLFAQFWSTFAVIRTINWMIRKLLVILGIRTETEFKAWAEAVAATQQPQAPNTTGPKSSGWPVLMFFGIVAAAPYLVFKMISGLTKSINEHLHDPTTWHEPLRAIAQFSFTATTPQELSIMEKQSLTVAPQHLQPQLWNSGWLMATIDGKTAGLVPVNYIKLIKPTKHEDKVEQKISEPLTGEFEQH